MRAKNSINTALLMNFTRSLFILKQIKKYGKHFTEGSWKDKLMAAKELVGENVLMPMIRLYFIMKSDTVPTHKKLYIAGALGYFILPFDIIPDFLAPIIGFSDDLAVATIVYKMVQKYSTPEVEHKARHFYSALCPLSRKTKMHSLASEPYESYEL